MGLLLTAPGKITLALTGSFGSGKSTTLALFQKLGAHVENCDRLAHQLLAEPDLSAVNGIEKIFGPHVMDSSGRLDRKRIAYLVFTDLKKRRRLEKILHPQIIQELKRNLSKARGPIRIVEVPLLFEKKLDKLFDASILTRAPVQLIFGRLKKKGYTARSVRARLRWQLSDLKKRKKVDFILDNNTNNSIRFLTKQVQTIYEACVNVINS